MIQELMTRIMMGEITLREALEKAAEGCVKPESKIQIVIAPRGWVFVGYVSREDEDVVVRNSHVIRVWGTTKGLGELIKGPTSKTVLDACGVTRIPVSAVLAKIDCEESSWKIKI